MYCSGFQQGTREVIHWHRRHRIQFPKLSFRMTDRIQPLRRGPESWKTRWISLSHWIVTLVVSFIAWISAPYNRAKRYVHENWWLLTAWRSRKKRGHPGGRRPKEPKVLGVVLFQQSFRAQDDQALSRILTWYDVAYKLKHYELILTS
jgi:hypothetical protein